MIYSKNYFGKNSVEDIDHKDVLRFFKTEKSESNKIEFKSSGTNKHTADKKAAKIKILESVCAFLNSDGGIIIWGAPVGQMPVNGKEKVFMGELSYVPWPYEKDQFITIVTDSITPTPTGIFFQPIKHNGQHLYIIEVEKSNYTPHQYKDKFYMRQDGQTQTAPYHFVEAMFKKVQFPNLEAFIKVNSVQYSEREYIVNLYLTFLNVSPMLNDRDLTFSIATDKGSFFNKGYNGDSNLVKLDSGRRMRNLKFAEYIFYGEPVSAHLPVYISEKDLDIPDSTPRLKIIVTFGSRSAPLKYCRYHIDLNIKNKNKCKGDVKILSENKLLSEPGFKENYEKFINIMKRNINDE